MPAQYANEECRLLNQEMYWEASYPSNSRVIEKEVWIKPETGLPPVYGEQAEGLVLERRTLYQDPVTELYCADCRRNLDETGKIQYERHVVNEQTTARIHND